MLKDLEISSPSYELDRPTVASVSNEFKADDENHVNQYHQRIQEIFERNSEIFEQLAPSIELSIAAHEGRNGPGGMPLALHCADVATALPEELTTLEQYQLGFLHDAATPAHSNFTQDEFVEKARAAGCTDKVIAGALCFARPQEGWQYDDWVSFLKRHELTRQVKIADSEAAINGFVAESDNQLAAWKRTRDRLASDEVESDEVTARIAASMQVHPLPDLQAMEQAELAA